MKHSRLFEDFIDVFLEREFARAISASRHLGSSLYILNTQRMAVG